MRGVGRNDDDIARSDFSTRAIGNRAATRARAIEHFHDDALGRRLARIVDGAARYECRVAIDDVVDLGDLTVLNAAARTAARGLGAMHDADSDVVLVVDAYYANGL